MAQNLLDFSVENHNDLVNPNEVGWRWEKLDDRIASAAVENQ